MRVDCAFSVVTEMPDFLPDRIYHHGKCAIRGLKFRESSYKEREEIDEK